MDLEWELCDVYRSIRDEIWYMVSESLRVMLADLHAHEQGGTGTIYLCALLLVPSPLLSIQIQGPTTHCTHQHFWIKY